MQPQEDEVLYADRLLQLRRDQRVSAGPQLRQGQDQPRQRSAFTFSLSLHKKMFS